MKKMTCFLVLVSFAVHADDADYAAARAAMVEEVQLYARMTGDIEFSEPVLVAMQTVPRHSLVPASQLPFAYENRPLPIGHGQTISQPYIVALMTELASPDDDDVVLEVGTGSGYQAAILGELVKHVYTIEIIEALAERATEKLAGLGYENVTTKLGDGYYGWEAHAPYDAIVVTAAASHVPPPLIAQLKPGGRMIIPVGGRFVTQLLLMLEKTEQGEIISRQIAAVRFVPLTGEH